MYADPAVMGPMPFQATMAQDPEKATMFERNQRWASPAPQGYVTRLVPEDEAAFQHWVKTNNIPYDAAPDADYDMRGFWKAQQSGDPDAQTSINENDGRVHFTDTYKTPTHKSFSRESMFATSDAPQWNAQDQLVDNDGNVVYDERAEAQSRKGK